MAISDIKEYAHLTDADVEALSDQLTSYPLEADGAAEYAAVPDAAARLVIHGSRTTVPPFAPSSAQSVLGRRDDPVTLVCFHDVTELLWNGVPATDFG
ncbi:hypothetical protein ACVH9Z_05235 [Rhodococcus opacus]|uniref:Uncharacterized protein n=1 Tax=Rhodococcus opacus TaxID=37919 RepID=A0AAX3YQL2_RHOOP|nr:hypothetical protein [Rhodococcus opacus]ELB90387.1 hypothetical protein Rwratislav_24621 [Rhodococcus wratislaviensis IFP 2016]MCZ4584356.1 hypothetical protein [Rhodococcus opacus]UNN01774.1 hypothetical protein MOO23_04600 [Rhodococcus opacus]WLF50759.1 hypothetical protein Q5707_18045 [Rhodococcus opacus]CAG7625072.1 hypothetical protein E143388_06701 [Rhodococcus opacus]